MGVKFWITVEGGFLVDRLTVLMKVKIPTLTSQKARR